METDRSAPASGTDAGGDAACWLDQVRDCCGTVVGEPHRKDCPEATGAPE